MPEHESCFQQAVEVVQPDVPVAVNPETLAVQGGVAVATILSLAVLCSSFTRLVKAIRAD
ncbi:MAG: hypothetical protein F6J95_033430 [Leptolyngbya sp. SIO1E4]|nr:hypothetical protein [Leptolyngbya sp. SIO1E4]